MRIMVKMVNMVEMVTMIVMVILVTMVIMITKVIIIAMVLGRESRLEMVIMVKMVIMVEMFIMVEDRTGQTKLIFKLDFPDHLCWAGFAILEVFGCYGHFALNVLQYPNFAFKVIIDWQI